MRTVHFVVSARRSTCLRGLRTKSMGTALGPFRVMRVARLVILVAVMAVGCASSRHGTRSKASDFDYCCRFDPSKVLLVEHVTWGPFSFDLMSDEVSGPQAREALSTVLRAAEFVHRTVGWEPRLRLPIVLRVTAGCEDGRPPCQVDGEGALALAFDGSYQGQFLANAHNRLFTSVLIHELTHLFVLSYVTFEDRWLDEGIAEYVATGFLASEDPSFARSLGDTLPAPVALHRESVRPWPVSERLPRRLRREEAAIDHVTHLRIRRYQAAEELVGLWVEAARSRGVDRPIRDLVARLAREPQPVSFAAVESTCRAQTGLSLVEVAAMTPARLSTLRSQAAQSLTSKEVRESYWALAVAAEFGTDEEITWNDVRNALALHSSAPERWRCEVLRAAAAIAGRWGNGAARVEILERSFDQNGNERGCALPAAYWQGLAAEDLRKALVELERIIANPGRSIVCKVEANAALRALTGRDAGWSWDLNERTRARAARRWAQIVELETRATVP